MANLLRFGQLNVQPQASRSERLEIDSSPARASLRRHYRWFHRHRLRTRVWRVAPHQSGPRLDGPDL